MWNITSQNTANKAAKYMPLRENFPVAHTAAKSSFFVGTYAGIDEQKLDYIQDTVDPFSKIYYSYIE